MTNLFDQPVKNWFGYIRVETLFSLFFFLQKIKKLIQLLLVAILQIFVHIKHTTVL